MARGLTGSSNQALAVDSALFGAPPFTLAAWFRTTLDGAGQTIVSIGDKDASLEYWALAAEMKTGGDPASFVARTASAENRAQGSTLSTGTWYHIVGRVVDSPSPEIRLYLNGSNVTGVTRTENPAGEDNLSIGRQANSTASVFFTGDVAEVAYWSAGLGTGEIAALAKGVSPALIRKASLVEYWNLIRGVTGLRGLTLTEENTPAVSAHPRVFYPSRAIVEAPAADTTLTPDAVTVPLSVPAPSAVIVNTLSPDPVIVPTSIPEPYILGQDRYWVGGSANWSAASWAAYSNGPAGAPAPGDGNNAIIDSNSGTPTIGIDTSIDLGSGDLIVTSDAGAVVINHTSSQSIECRDFLQQAGTLNHSDGASIVCSRDCTTENPDEASGTSCMDLSVETGTWRYHATSTNSPRVRYFTVGTATVLRPQSVQTGYDIVVTRRVVGPVSAGDIDVDRTEVGTGHVGIEIQGLVDLVDSSGEITVHDLTRWERDNSGTGTKTFHAVTLDNCDVLDFTGTSSTPIPVWQFDGDVTATGAWLSLEKGVEADLNGHSLSCDQMRVGDGNSGEGPILNVNGGSITSTGYLRLRGGSGGSGTPAQVQLGVGGTIEAAYLYASNTVMSNIVTGGEGSSITLTSSIPSAASTYYFANAPLGDEANDGLSASTPKELPESNLGLLGSGVRFALRGGDTFDFADGTDIDASGGGYIGGLSGFGTGQPKIRVPSNGTLYITHASVNSPQLYDVVVEFANVPLAPDPVTVPLSIAAPTVALSETISPDAVSVTVAPVAPSIGSGTTIAPDPIGSAVTTVAPTLSASATVSPDAVAAPLATPAPTLSIILSVAPDPVEVPVTVNAATLAASLSLAPDAVEVVAAIPTPSLSTGSILVPDTVAVTMAIPAPSVSISGSIMPSPVVVQVSVVDPSLSASLTITPLFRRITVSPELFPPTVSLNYPLAPDAVAVQLVVTAVSMDVVRLPSPVAVTFGVPTPTAAISTVAMSTEDFMAEMFRRNVIQGDVDPESIAADLFNRQDF